MLAFLGPLALVVLASATYNIASKAMPADCSPYLALVITYLAAALLSLLCHLIFEPGVKIAGLFAKMNWAMGLLAISMVGLEVGYIFTYRAGWKISLASLVANILLALLLLALGVFFYKEKISPRQLLGIIVSIAGIFILATGRE